MSQTQTKESEYELEPDVDADLVERIQNYSLRKKGRYVEGRVSSVEEGRRGKIKLTIDLPTETFTQSFHEPDPEHTKFEVIADEYGLGLVDIGSLKGETVWCTKESGGGFIHDEEQGAKALHDNFSCICEYVEQERQS